MWAVIKGRRLRGGRPAWQFRRLWPTPVLGGTGSATFWNDPILAKPTVLLRRQPLIACRIRARGRSIAGRCAVDDTNTGVSIRCNVTVQISRVDNEKRYRFGSTSR